MQKIKKILSGAILLSLLLPALSAPAYNVGDKIGKVLSTDIVTYIDSIRVPSFNIAGRTAVIVENLNAKGLSFGVSYDNLSRTLSIEGSDIFGTGGRDYFHFESAVSSLPVGTPVMDVIHTDIKTLFSGTQLESFNIGGFTCVYADDLAKLCGSYDWNEESRSVNVYTQGKPAVPTLITKASGRSLSADESVITKNETFMRWATPSSSHLIKNDDGTYFAVEISEHINIEAYDGSFNHISSFAIKKELPLFGALYSGKDFNYIAFGQENLLDDNSREVIKIVIYDKSFVKISEVSISNCKTAVPFDASAGEMYEDDNYLVLHTSRSQYRDEMGNRPQTQLTIIVDKKTWTVCNMPGKFQYNHISHAFRECVRIDEGKIVTANYSDAAPIRGAFLQVLDFSGKVLSTQSIFNAGGPAGANCTGAMIGGLEVSESGYLAPLSTIDHSLATGYSNVNVEGVDRENRDIYLLWTNKETGEMKHACLARYTGVGLTGSVPYIVKLAGDNFMVLWQRFTDSSEESNTVCYAFIDRNGNQIGETKEVTALLSEDCKPVEVDGRVIWYVNTADSRKFYSLSANIPSQTAEPEIIPPVEELPPAEIIDKKENFEEAPEKDKITEVEGI